MKSRIEVVRKNNINIWLANSKIINVNYDAKTILFDHCNNVKLIGGQLLRLALPKIQNNKDQHTLTFIGGKNITVKSLIIKNSPEMGICLMSVINASILNNTIEHTLRDGVYAHYSLNLKYIGNTLSHIKDDALSMHDYGRVEQKPEIFELGYRQAGHSVISKNKISNAIQGISSIGCSTLLIENNIVNRTANAGIAVFNSEQLAKGQTARVNNIIIRDNRLINCGDTVKVNGNTVTNGGQLTSGRAALYVASNSGEPDQRFMNSKLRLSQITVSNNYIFNSAVNGALFYNIDNLKVTSNSFINCHSNRENSPQFTGNIFEMYNCSKVYIAKNNIIDNRKEPLHD
ncbi:MAG: right-handed parallel beta-helix repeat-containing protein, partial [Pedobacter sp.]